MWNTLNTKLKNSPIRRTSAIVILLTVIASIVYMKFFFDETLRNYIEDYATSLHGAKVNVASLHTDLFRGIIDIGGIEIAHPAFSRKNLFAIDKVHVELLDDTLIRNKIVIKEMIVEGVHYLTPRNDPGDLPPELSYGPGYNTVMDRATPLFYKSLRDETNRNPLRLLENFGKGFDLRPKVQSLSGQYATNRKADELLRSIENNFQKWEKNYDELNRSRQEGDWKKELDSILAQRKIAKLPSREQLELRKKIQMRNEQVRRYITQFRADMDSFNTKASNLETNMDEDILLVHDTLGLPRFDSDDLTPVVLGPKILQYMERLTYWVDWSRRRMMHVPGKYDLRGSSRGVNINFLKTSAYPSFMLMHGKVVQNKNDGDFSAEWGGMTTNPSIYRYPFFFKASGGFPNEGVQNIRADFLIDHTTKDQKETFQLSIGSYPLEHWQLNQGGNLVLNLDNSKIRADFNADFFNNQLNASWTFEFRNTQFNVTSQYKTMADLVQNVLAPVSYFEVTGSLQGPFDKLKLEAHSDMGKRLASGLQSEFRSYLGGIDDDLKQSLVEYFEPTFHQIHTRLRDLETKYFNPIDIEEKQLDALQRQEGGSKAMD